MDSIRIEFEISGHVLRQLQRVTLRHRTWRHRNNMQANDATLANMAYVLFTQGLRTQASDG